MNLLLLEIKFSFFHRTTYLNKEGNSPIVLRIVYRGQRADVFTGLYCSPDFWDAPAQRLSSGGKQAARINANLEDISHKCRETFDEMKYSGRPFTLDEYVMKIKGTEDAPETIIEFLNDKVVELTGRVGVDITEATLQKYNRCISMT